jgi:hypothetical protein
MKDGLSALLLRGHFPPEAFHFSAVIPHFLVRRMMLGASSLFQKSKGLGLFAEPNPNFISFG